MKQLKWIRDFLTIAHIALSIFTIGYLWYNRKALTAADKSEEE